MLASAAALQGKREERYSMKTELTVQHVDGLRFLASTNSQAVIVDAPPDEGGLGTAMSSPQLLAASLGSCALSFVANSCRLHGLPLEHLSLEMMYEEAQRPQRISRIAMRIHIEPPLPPERRRAVLGVANHSTVANTLAHPPEIHITLE
jgi:uncharacterized OsmC-like protein